jgi:glycosyltransferase involved in cell wall biosynthesis
LRKAFEEVIDLLSPSKIGSELNKTRKRSPCVGRRKRPVSVDVRETNVAETDREAVAGDGRPVLAIVCNAQTPYRLHLHRRIAAEIPELKLHSVYHWPVGFDAFTALEDSIGPVPLCQAPPRRLPGRLAQEWAAGGRVICWLKRQNIAAVVVLGYSDLARFRVLRWCQRNRLATLMWGDSNVLLDRPAGIKRLLKGPIVKRIVSRCDAWLPCGSLGRQYFLRYGARADRIFLFPNEPDYDLIRKCDAERIERVKAEFGFKDQRRRLVYSGRLVPVKRVDLAIDAFASIAAGRPQWDLVIAGKGPLEESLRARVPAALRDRVIWTGFLEQPDLSAVYRLSDALVLPSSYEPWALVLNEATAAGLAIVSSDVVGAAPELVSEGENGMTFRSEDRAALVEALLRVTDEGNIEKMKAASPRVLARWCEIADPVTGLRRALEACGALPVVG